jgi:hypothetical protein
VARDGSHGTWRPTWRNIELCTTLKRRRKPVVAVATRKKRAGIALGGWFHAGVSLPVGETAAGAKTGEWETASWPRPSASGAHGLSALAEDERGRILARANGGRAAAKKRGVKFGPKPKLAPHQQREAVRMVREGQSLGAVAHHYHVGHSTIVRALERTS